MKKLHAERDDLINIHCTMQNKKIFVAPGHYSDNVLTTLDILKSRNSFIIWPDSIIVFPLKPLLISYKSKLNFSNNPSNFILYKIGVSCRETRISPKMSYLINTYCVMHSAYRLRKSLHGLAFFPLLIFSLFTAEQGYQIFFFS